MNKPVIYLILVIGHHVHVQTLICHFMKARISTPLLFLCLLFQITALAQENLSTSRWEVLDIQFTFKIKKEDPFLVQLGAKFTHETGFTMEIPGFYDGGNSWIIRFCPSLDGAWSFVTYSSVPKLSGKSGIIQVEPNNKPGRHGPLVISEYDPRKFTYEDGTPYFLLAYELDWLFALDWDNKEDIPNTKSIIDQVAAKKFNHIVMNVYAYDANWGERERIEPRYNFSEPEVFPFAGNNMEPDFSRLNIDFFQHLERVIAYLNEKQIVAHLMIYVWNKKVNWPEPESEADNLYFDYVVKRYQAFPNLVWDISKEALAYGRNDMGYITKRIDRLRQLDGHQRLLSVHDYGYCNAFPGKVDFISIQSWRSNIYDAMLEVSQEHHKKPIFNIEHGGYERSMDHFIFNGAYEDAVACLDRNYLCAFAGTYSTYYWQHTSWYEVVYDPASLPDQNQPKYAYYRHFSSLFQAFDFGKLNPAKSISNTACLTDHQTSYLFYIPRDMISIQGNFRELKNKKVKIKWFDPFTGQFHGSDTRQFGDDTWSSFKRHEKISAPFCVAVIEVME